MSETEIKETTRKNLVAPAPSDESLKKQKTASANTTKPSWWSAGGGSTNEKNQAKFEQFNEAEESTCIESITLLQFSFLKTLCAIILSPCTIFLLALYIYWYNSYKKFWFFTEVSCLEQASFVYIQGKPGN